MFMIYILAHMRKVWTEHIMMNGEKGFTLIELMVVLTILGILLAVGIPQYKNSILKSKETVLKENLFLMRKMINQFYLDKKKYPRTLQELVDEGYLKSIPYDPITKSDKTWKTVREQPPEEGEYYEEELGITDVFSGAVTKSKLTEKPYSEY